MKPIVQKLPLLENNPLMVQNFETPYFEIDWHQHIDNELILFTKGSGLVFLGNQVGKYEAGDIYFLGSHLPHAFQVNECEITTAIVVQFRNDCLGSYFLTISECRQLVALLEIARNGIMLSSNNTLQLQSLIKAMLMAKDMNRIILLLQILQHLITEKKYVPLSKRTEQKIQHINNKNMDSVFEYTLASFNETISLSKVAAIACMSIPSFCYYFKLYMQKTYFDYLNEVRITYACHLLLETNKPIAAICYDSGYNTIAHFHRQFLKLNKITPLQFRKTFSTSTQKNLMNPQKLLKKHSI